MIVPFYCQANPLWKDKILGKRETFQEAGCLVTCVAMLASAKTGKEITPLMVDEWMDTHHGYQGDAVIWDKALSYLQSLYIPFTHWEHDFGNYETIKWRDGDIPILRVLQKSGHYHYVVLLDKTGKCNDPAHIVGANNTLKQRGYIPDRVTWFW